MDKKILRDFAKNGLEILQWSILLLLYETDGHTLKYDDIQKDLNLPITSDDSKPGGANKNAFTREILKSLKSSEDKDGYVKPVEGKQATWKLTPEGKRFVENGLDS